MKIFRAVTQTLCNFYTNAQSMVTAVVTGTIFLFRGRNYQHAIWGDDRSLFDHAIGGRDYVHVPSSDELSLLHHAIERQSILERFRFIDPFGLFDIANGYLSVIPRIVTKALVIGGSEYFTLRTFIIMSLAWTAITTCIAVLISKLTSPYLGFLAALIIAIMPYSNLVMLAQINTLTWPSALIVIIAVVTRQYPQSYLLQFSTCIFFALVTLSTIISIIPISYLIWHVYIRTEKAQPIERRLVWVMGGLFALQVLSYVPRGQNNSPSGLLYEISLVSYAFAPQFVRNTIFEPRTIIANIILYGLPILLSIMIFILLRLGNQSERRRQVKIAKHFFLIALLLIVVLIIGNGWLNSHYLFIPAGLFWLGVLLVCDSVAHSISRFRMVSIAIVAVIFLRGLSGTYFVI